MTVLDVQHCGSNFSAAAEAFPLGFISVVVKLIQIETELWSKRLCAYSLAA